MDCPGLGGARGIIADGDKGTADPQRVLFFLSLRSITKKHLRISKASDKVWVNVIGMTWFDPWSDPSHFGNLSQLTYIRTECCLQCGQDDSSGRICCNVAKMPVWQHMMIAN